MKGKQLLKGIGYGLLCAGAVLALVFLVITGSYYGSGHSGSSSSYISYKDAKEGAPF